MLQTAQRRAEELGVENVRFKQIDADTSIDLEAASIDGVLARFGYMLMADPEHALRETRRVLRPGRRVALAAWAEPDANPWSVLRRRALIERGLDDDAAPDTPHQFTWARRETIAEALEGAGFTEFAIEPLDFAIPYRSAADWWTAQSDLSMRFAAAVARASDDELAAAGDELDERAGAVPGRGRHAADPGARLGRVGLGLSSVSGPQSDAATVQTIRIATIAPPMRVAASALPRPVPARRRAWTPSTIAATASGRPQTKPPPGSVSQVSIEPGTDSTARTSARTGRAGRAGRSMLPAVDAIAQSTSVIVSWEPDRPSTLTKTPRAFA